jgi:hypothetical protein
MSKKMKINRPNYMKSLEQHINKGVVHRSLTTTVHFWTSILEELFFFPMILGIVLRVLVLIRQALYHLSHAFIHSIVLLLVCVSDRIFYFCLAQPETEILLPLPPD